MRLKKQKQLGLGITFLFEVAAKRAIKAGELSEIDLVDYFDQREFNFVMLKNSFFREHYLKIYQVMKNASLEMI